MASFDDIRLETPRLILRPPRPEDLDAWTEMMLDEPTARFIGGVMPRPLCWRQLMTMIGAWHAQGFAMFSVIEKASGRWIGRARTRGSRKAGRAPRSDGRSSATAGAGATRSKGPIAATTGRSTRSAGRRSFTRSRRRTSPSQRVAEKLGSRRIWARASCRHRTQTDPIDLWGQTREEWRSRHR